MFDNSLDKLFKSRPHEVFMPFDLEIIASCCNIFLIGSEENSSIQIDKDQNLELFAHCKPNLF